MFYIEKESIEWSKTSRNEKKYLYKHIWKTADIKYVRNYKNSVTNSVK